MSPSNTRRGSAGPPTGAGFDSNPIVPTLAGATLRSPARRAEIRRQDRARTKHRTLAGVAIRRKPRAGVCRTARPRCYTGRPCDVPQPDRSLPCGDALPVRTGPNHANSASRAVRACFARGSYSCIASVQNYAPRAGPSVAAPLSTQIMTILGRPRRLARDSPHRFRFALVSKHRTKGTVQCKQNPPKSGKISGETPIKSRRFGGRHQQLLQFGDVPSHGQAVSHRFVHARRTSGQDPVGHPVYAVR